MPWACMTDGWGLGAGGMMWPVGLLASAAFWGLLVWGAIALWRGLSGGRHDAEAVLARRFAAGELSPEEYDARLGALRAERRGSFTGAGR